MEKYIVLKHNASDDTFALYEIECDDVEDVYDDIMPTYEDDMYVKVMFFPVETAHEILTELKMLLQH